MEGPAGEETLSNMEGDAALFSISSVARIIGVPVATLRTWEDRYGLVVPERSPSGRRLYSRNQVSALEFVKLQIEGGVSAADAHRLLDQRMRSAPAPADRPEPGKPGKPHTVLVADSDPYASEFEEHFLKSAGYGVEVALNVEDAVSAIDEVHPELVVVEVLISGGRGLELCRLVKRREAPPAVLAVSTLDAPDRAAAAGADAFLQKPLERPRFLRAVQGLLVSGGFENEPAVG